MTINRLDLRSITRKSDKHFCRVELRVDWQTRLDWIVLGQTCIGKAGNDNNPGKWLLKAYLGSDMTDFEHDSAYAIRLPLIGVQFQYVEYNTTYLYAWIDSDAEDEFCVPPPDYEPSKASDTVICTLKDCARGQHPIVRNYSPPRNPSLYKAVRGKPVTIWLGGVSQ